MGGNAIGRLMAVAALAVLLSMMYLANLPGLTGEGYEAMLNWGRWSLGLGVLTVLGALGLAAGKGWASWPATMLMAIIFMMQLLPLGLWTVLYNQFALESPPVGAAQHWLWAVPHLVLAVLATIEGRRLLNTDAS